MVIPTVQLLHFFSIPSKEVGLTAQQAPQVGAIDQFRYLGPGNVKFIVLLPKFNRSLVSYCLQLLHSKQFGAIGYPAIRKHVNLKIYRVGCRWPVPMYTMICSDTVRPALLGGPWLLRKEKAWVEAAALLVLQKSSGRPGARPMITNDESSRKEQPALNFLERKQQKYGKVNSREELNNVFLTKQPAISINF